MLRRRVISDILPREREPNAPEDGITGTRQYLDESSSPRRCHVELQPTCFLDARTNAMSQIGSSASAIEAFVLPSFVGLMWEDHPSTTRILPSHPPDLPTETLERHDKVLQLMVDFVPTIFLCDPPRFIER